MQAASEVAGASDRGGVRPHVVLAGPDSRDPGGITAVAASWREAGLADAVELTELPTSAMDAPLAVKLLQAGRAVVRLVWLLLSRSSRPDVVHLNASTGGSLWRKLVLAWCCRLGRVPYVAQMHSGGFESWLEASALNRAGARSLFGHAEVSVVLGERWRSPMRTLGAGRIEVLPNAIGASERRRLATVAERRRRHLRAPGEPAVLLFYGRWAPVKGADRFADALRALGRDDYEVRLFGNGDRDWLERCFEGIGGEVRIGGWLDGERKLAELAEADAVVAPSRREGLPTALLEARAAAVPVIVTDVGAVPDALAGYPDALVLPDGDDPGLRAAIARVLDRDWPIDPAPPVELPLELRSEHAVERLVQIYGSVVAKGV